MEKDVVSSLMTIRHHMRRNGMELRVLRYFLMVAREENITNAAEVLHITQPTLSR